MAKVKSLNSDERFNFMLSLVGYLGHNPDAPISQVAELFKVSEAEIRTVIRMLNELEVYAGSWLQSPFYIDVDAADEGILRLVNNDFESDAPVLSTRQISAIAAGLDYLAQLEFFANDGELKELQSLLSTGKTSELQSKVAIVPGSIEESTELLRQSIIQGRSVSCEYINSHGEHSHRILDCLRIDLNPDGRYLRAWCHNSKELKTFRLDRMRSIRILEQEAEKTLADFDEISSSTYIPGEFDTEVELELEPEAYVLAANYSTVAEPTEGNSLRITIRVGKLSNVAKLVARFQGKAKVIGPEAAREYVADYARRALATLAAQGQDDKN